MMLRKLTLIAAAGAALLSVTTAGAQVDGNRDPSAPFPPGYGRQAPPPAYQPPPPQQRRYQPPVQSQPYGYRDRDNGWDRGPRYVDRDNGWDRGPRYGYDERPRYRERGRFGDYCATSRGACQTRPQPVGSSCRCDIDGLIKRGIIQ